MKRINGLNLIEEREGAERPAQEGDRTMSLGQREAIVGVEEALMGMKAGGYRKVRISPHLAY